MKILQRDWKQGRVKLMPETGDDLWYLHTLIDDKDRVEGQSEYKFKLGSADSKVRVVKKRVWVAIQVARNELEGSSLRISGDVVDGSEDVPRGSHHGLDISVGTEITLVKDRWLDFHKEKLDEAVKSARLKTLLVLFDRERALFFLLTPSGHKKLLDIKGDIPKKGLDEKKQHTFYNDIVQHLESLDARHKSSRIVAASPSFWNEYLKKELKGDISKKVIFTSVSGAEEAAIPELLKRPELQKALDGERSAREAIMVEELMEALGKDKLIYGHDDLKKAISEGNITSLTVTEHEISKRRDSGNFEELEELMKAASDVGASVHLLSTEHAMSKIDGLGGAVGVKRWQ
ncbi:mRNA surveillance protein pelota [Candidatus Woesearchaeota archaeon]|nr:mRNA surveillance protein pelota [Candidatus Woesearchaeota archaeon]